MIHPIIIEFNKEGIDVEDIDEKLQHTIFRIVQEQVNNILKHANATNTINLSRDHDDVVLLISDNGEWNDILKEINGVGMINIKSRADCTTEKLQLFLNPGVAMN